MSDFLAMINLPDFQSFLFFEIMSLILVSGLLMLAEHLRSGKPEAGLFKYICCFLIVDLFIEVSVYAVVGLEGTFFNILFAALYSLSETMDLFRLFFWVMYVEYLLYILIRK